MLIEKFSLFILICTGCLLLFYELIKLFRGKRGALNSHICLKDINILYFISFLLGIASHLPDVFLSFLLFFLVIYFLLLILDAALFIQYRIEINRQSIVWFFTGVKGLKKGIPYLFSAFKQYPWILLVPIGLIFLVYLLFNLTAVNILLVDGNYSIFVSFLVSTAFLITLNLLTKIFNSAFYSTHSLLLNLFLSDDFVCSESGDIKVSLRPEHKSYLRQGSKKQLKSKFFGQCKKSNIILITMESLGCYVKPYGPEVTSKLAGLFESNSWISTHHYSLCPNTTVATNQIYSGAYSNNPYNKSDSLYPGIKPRHLQVLKKNGYQTLFLDSANLSLYNYKKLLKQIGFDFIWGTDDLPSSGLKADYRLLNMIDPIVESISNKPFFLHLINDQTHMPYELIDKNKYNHNKGKSQKSLYLNAVEEVDSIIDVFLKQLANKIDLSNTIMVFTGDHGESFGEYGYYFHSNSIIPQQTQVPFMLKHPNLENKQIEHSCHFDLFPTFFDLLGLEYDYDCFGSSIALANEESDYSYFAHSATLKGNTPANFCWVNRESMYWVDRLFNQTYRLNHKSHKKELLKGKEKNYYNYFLMQFLKQQKLIDDSK